MTLWVPVRLLIGGNGPVSGQMENVSVSGAFVRTHWSGPLGVRVEIEVLRGGPFGQRLGPVAAHLIRQTPDGAALEWCDLAPQPVKVLLDATSARAACGSHPEESRRVRPNEPIPAPCAVVSSTDEPLRATG